MTACWTCACWAANTTCGGWLALTRTGAHVDVPGVAYARGRRIRVERVDGRPLWFGHDGEVAARSRAGYTLTAVPAAVPVIAAPAARAAA